MNGPRIKCAAGLLGPRKARQSTMNIQLRLQPPCMTFAASRTFECPVDGALLIAEMPPALLFRQLTGGQCEQSDGKDVGRFCGGKSTSRKPVCRTTSSGLHLVGALIRLVKVLLLRREVHESRRSG